MAGDDDRLSVPCQSPGSVGAENESSGPAKAAVDEAHRAGESDDTPGSPNYNVVHKMVAGAMKSTIDAHGPISKEWVGSAAKRVVKELISKGALVPRALEPHPAREAPPH